MSKPAGRRVVAEVVWSARARVDLREIEDYLSLVSTQMADRIVDAILVATSRLESFPLSGREVPELRPAGFREVLHRNYRIVYLYDEESDRVDIHTVVHGSRMLGDE
jgi:plasmid stabilization system protein ParE